MHTDIIIKRIGRRPVYRVERKPSSAFRVFEDRSGRMAQATPVVDRRNWQRTGEPAIADGWN